MTKAFSTALDDFVYADQIRTDWKMLGLRCIGCDLDVFHRNAGGNQPANFVHYHNNPIMKMCALRSASSNAENTYRNVSKSPFNIVLTHTDNHFHLYAEIRPLPSQVKVSLNKTIGIISDNNRYALSQFLDNTKLIPLSKIPLETEVRIIHDKSEEMYDLVSVWGKEIDHFVNGGAFFNIESGKKVPPNGCIYCGEDYYFITSNDNTVSKLGLKTTFEKIQPNIVGSLIFGYVPLSVYSIHIPEIPSKPIIEFCGKFKTNLCEKNAKPQLLWPPSINVKDVKNPLWDDSEVIISINAVSNRRLWIIDDGIRDPESDECRILEDRIILFQPLSEDTSLFISQGTDIESIKITRNTAGMNIENIDEESASLCNDLGEPCESLNSSNNIKTNFIGSGFGIGLDGTKYTIPIHETITKLPVELVHLIVLDKCLSYVAAYKSVKSPNTTIPIFKNEYLRTKKRTVVTRQAITTLRNISKMDPTLTRLTHLAIWEESIPAPILNHLRKRGH